MSAYLAAASLAPRRASAACCPGSGAWAAPAGLANNGMRAAATAPITTRKRRSALSTAADGSDRASRCANAVRPAAVLRAGRSGSGGGRQAARDLLQGCDSLIEGRVGLEQPVEPSVNVAFPRVERRLEPQVGRGSRRVMHRRRVLAQLLQGRDEPLGVPCDVDAGDIGECFA